MAGIPPAPVTSTPVFAVARPAMTLLDDEYSSWETVVVAGYVASAGVAERVVLHPGNSWFEIPLYAQELVGGHGAGGGVDLALLDADHTIEGVVRDFLAVEGLVEIGGFVLLHDTYPEMCGHAGWSRAGGTSGWSCTWAR